MPEIKCVECNGQGYYWAEGNPDRLKDNPEGVEVLEVSEPFDGTICIKCHRCKGLGKGHVQCQTLRRDDTRCPYIATHTVSGRPGYMWSGVHCDDHTQSSVLHYDHQGGCVVGVIR
jgi:hypothetical protein